MRSPEPMRPGTWTSCAFTFKSSLVALPNVKLQRPAASRVPKELR